MQPVDVYIMYCALKAHFGKGDYDYIKYGGKSSATRDSFWKRTDRIFFVKISRKYKKKNVLCILYTLRAVSICIFIFSPPSLLNSIIFGVTFGLLWLSTVPPTNGIVAQIFGTKYLSTLFGIVFLCHQLGAFAGAFLGGYFYDVYGSYDYAWYIAIALSIFATAVHFPIDERRLVRVDKTI